MTSRWDRAIAELSAQGDAARAAAQRVDEAPSVERTTAVAISYKAETDYLRSANTLLRAHLTEQRPPRRLPVARVWPCFRDVWKAQALDRLGGVWRAIPGDAAVKQMRSTPSDALLAAVVEQAEGLQASLRGDRTVDRLYESYIPDRTGSPVAALLGGGRSAPTLPGFPNLGHPLNRAFPGAAAYGSSRTVKTSSTSCRATGSRCTPGPSPSVTRSSRSSSSAELAAPLRSPGVFGVPGAGWDASGSWCRIGRSGRRSSTHSKPRPWPDWVGWCLPAPGCR